MASPASGRKSCCKPLGAAQQQGEGKKLKKQENQTGFSEPASGPSPEGAGSGLGPGPSGCNGWGAGGVAVGSAHICFEIISRRTDRRAPRGTDTRPPSQSLPYSASLGACSRRSLAPRDARGALYSDPLPFFPKGIEFASSVIFLTLSINLALF